jgi:hypothetical protein
VNLILDYYSFGGAGKDEVFVQKDGGGCVRYQAMTRWNFNGSRSSRLLFAVQLPQFALLREPQANPA